MNIKSLPNETLLHCCSYLDIQTVGRLGQVNVRFALLTQDSYLWKTFVKTHFSSICTPPETHHRIQKKGKLRALIDRTASIIQSKISNIRVFPKSDWFILCRRVSTAWHAVKTLEEKKAVAIQENLDIKSAQIERFTTLCNMLKGKNIDLNQARNILNQDVALLFWKGEHEDAIIHYAIDACNVDMVKIILEANGSDLQIFKMESGTDTGIAKGLTPLQCAVFKCRSEASAIFRLILEKAKADKNILKINGKCLVFSSLLQIDRGADALLLLEALNGDIDHLFQERLIGKANVFHSLVWCKKEGGKIASILFNYLSQNKELLCKLMLSETESGWYSELPLHTAIRSDNIPVTQLYMAKMKELGIFDECLDTKNSVGKTPRDLLGDQRVSEWKKRDSAFKYY